MIDGVLTKAWYDKYNKKSGNQNLGILVVVDSVNRDMIFENELVVSIIKFPMIG